ncbi:MAG TPA: hypothetical protein VF785_16560 [Gemmatimonadaceae bacterium]
MPPHAQPDARFRAACFTALVVLFAPTFGAGLQAQAQQGTPVANAAALTAVKAALDKYKDPIVAVRDGYLSTVGCVDFPAGGTEHGSMEYKPGAMGVHFINMGLVGPKLDSTKPQVLLYEIVGDKLELTGAEWFVPTQLAKTPPTILGHKLMGPMEGHAPIMPAELHHWDLHVWLWKTNPNGMFSPTNAAVKCPKTGYAYTFADAPPKMVKP